MLTESIRIKVSKNQKKKSLVYDHVFDAFQLHSAAAALCVKSSNNLLLQLSFALVAREQRLQQYIEYGCQPLSAPFHSCTTACRREICHKHHKQRLCKIISSRVKFDFLSVLLEQFVYVSCGCCGNLKVLR